MRLDKRHIEAYGGRREQRHQFKHLCYTFPVEAVEVYDNYVVVDCAHRTGVGNDAIEVGDCKVALFGI